MADVGIIGIGETPCGKTPEFTTLGLHLEAIRLAVADAELRPDDVDGLLVDQPADDPFRAYALYLAHMAGIRPRYCTDLAAGGATPALMVIEAANAIRSGLAEVVVCVHAHKRATESPPRRNPGIREGKEDYEEPYGLIGPVPEHALAASRHMAEYGTTSRQFASVAVACRKHASLNPSAVKREPITEEDVLNSRMISSPLHLLDCCLNTDGGGAVVVASAERTARAGKRGVWVRGFGCHFPHASLLEASSITTLGGVKAARHAFEMAGAGPEDIDFAEIYDCFTPIVVITLEDYGFCAKGEGGSFVSSGNIELNGRLPVNTHGGLLSQGHVEGMLHITEAVKQLRGEVETARQVTNAHLAVISGHGAGLGAHAALVVGR